MTLEQQLSELRVEQHINRAWMVDLIDRVTELERQMAAIPDSVEKIMTEHDAPLMAKVDQLLESGP